MGKPPKRREVGTTGTGDLRVAIAGRNESLNTYKTRLWWTEDVVLATLKQLETGRQPKETQSHLNRLAKVLCCGRILGVDADDLGERCDYCDQRSICKCCQHQRAREKAQQAAEGLPRDTLDRAFDAYLSTPMPKSRREEIQYLLFLRESKQRLSKKLNKMRRNSPDWFPLKNYWIGPHSKQMKDSLVQLPHLHLVLQTGPQCDAKRIVQELEDYYYSHPDIALIPYIG